MSRITTHVLDTSEGKPAAGIKIVLFHSENNNWKEVTAGVTNNDGRISDLLKDNKKLTKGIYKLIFETGLYFRQKKLSSLYPYVEIVFEISDEEHYHIPLLLSPFGYTTYRGS